MLVKCQSAVVRKHLCVQNWVLCDPCDYWTLLGLRLQVPNVLFRAYQLYNLQLIPFQSHIKQLMSMQNWVFRVTSDWPVRRVPLKLQDMHQRYLMPDMRLSQTASTEFKQLVLMPINPILQHDPNQMFIVLNYMQDMHANITYSLCILRYWQDTRISCMSMPTVLLQ